MPKLFVARGRSVLRDGITYRPGELVDLPPAEAVFMMQRGFVQDSPPTLYPEAQPNPAGVGSQGANAQGPRFRS
jgi:hypothetical protein